MFTRLKGQGIIIEILLFMMAMFLAIMTFMILAAEDTTFETEAEAEVQKQTNLIREKSILTVMLEDSMWKDPDIGKSDYSDLPAIKVTSYYLSTDNRININGNSHSNENVKEDLESYYAHKLNSYFDGSRTGFRGQDFSFNVSNGDKTIEYESLNDREGQWIRMDRPLQLSNGETAEITFWVKHDNNN